MNENLLSYYRLARGDGFLACNALAWARSMDNIDRAIADADEPDDRCSDPAGHDWAINEESDRCYCMNCGADGDA